jgi:biotin operon repressor
VPQQQHYLCPDCGKRMRVTVGKGPDRVLQVLQRDKGRILSAELIAREADCALSSVQIYVSELRNHGHVIRAVRGQGYRYLGKVA